MIADIHVFLMIATLRLIPHAAHTDDYTMYTHQISDDPSTLAR